MDGNNIKRSPLKAFLIAGTSASIISLLYFEVSQNLSSRIINKAFGSGKCYVQTTVETKVEDSLLGLTKDVDARDRVIAIDLIRSWNSANGIQKDYLPPYRIIYTLKNENCSKIGAESLDYFIKNAGLLY